MIPKVVFEIFTVAQEGWFYSYKFNHAQKVNDGVYCYVTPLLCGFNVQLYLRGDTSFCKLEARTGSETVEGLIKMFELGDQWLDKYSTGDMKEIEQDFFSISNPVGAWREGSKDNWIKIEKTEVL